LFVAKEAAEKAKEGEMNAKAAAVKLASLQNAILSPTVGKLSQAMQDLLLSKYSDALKGT
jgi:hypothetical protein